jgi:hypothetical protein
MSSSNLVRPGVHTWSRQLVVVLCTSMMLPLARMQAQQKEEDHDHDHLHFSHPLVTESPSPDTKIRFDYLAVRTIGSAPERETDLRLEVEYGFADAISLAVVAPYVFRTSPVSTKLDGLGSVELSLKSASLRFAEHGILIGGGLSAALPTGSDTKGIGSAHLVGVAPFADIGYKRDALELVGLATFSTTLHRQSGEEADRTLSFNASSLYHIQPRLEGLFEISTSRGLSGGGSGTQQTFLAPGIKVYPFPIRRLMFGASFEFGTGSVRETRALLLSGFYHF